MFTGIIEELGRVEAIKRSASKPELTISALKVMEDLKVADSIAVNGVCLTVRSVEGKSFCANLMPETLKRTNLGEVASGEKVNLERALKFGERLGGHFVSGHIDGLGTIIKKSRQKGSIILEIKTRPEILKYLIPQGSVALDGVSLTVARVSNFSFSVSIIPHTAEVTTLGIKGQGSRVNLEVDMMAKYLRSQQ